jgi:serine/threonine protein kinase
MPTLSELGRILITCRVISAARWQHASTRGAGKLSETLDALVAEPPAWWSEAKESRKTEAPPGLTEYQRGIIEMWFEGQEIDLPRQLARNQFLLLEKLGEGGQGEVYRARQLNPNRFVAVKMLTQDSEKRRERFEQEARAMIRIHHPAVAGFYLYERVRDAEGQPTDEYLIAMEFVNGVDLSRLLNSCGVVAWPFVVRWAINLLDGLDVIHQHGFIHRDIKPANIMILGPALEEGASSVNTQAKLLDFGAVKPAADGEATPGRRIFVGTREYAPPEQWAQQTVPASDLYALGATLFHALTGRAPYQIEGRDAIALMKAHSRAPIPNLSDWNPDAPDELNQLIRRMLAKRPEDRGTAGELSQCFRRLVTGDEDERKASMTAPTARAPSAPKPARIPRNDYTAQSDTEPKNPLHGVAHPILTFLERIFLPSELRPVGVETPSVTERIAVLLRRPLVIVTLVTLLALIIYLLFW